MVDEKINFKPGDRVMVIEDSKPRYGTIRLIKGNGYDTIAIVDFKSDPIAESELRKIRIPDLVRVEIAEAKKSESIEKFESEKNEPIEKSEITITPDEFREIGVKTIVNLTLDKPGDALVFLDFLAELHKALFFGEVSENSLI